MNFHPAAVFFAWITWVGSVMMLPTFPFSPFLAIAPAIVLLAWRKARHRLKAVAAMMLPLALGFWLIHGGIFASLINPEGGGVLAGRGSWAFGFWLKIFSVVAASQIWMECVPPALFIRTLFAGSLPVSAAFLLAGPLLLAEQIRSRTAQIREAQLAMGIAANGRFRERLGALVSQITPLIFGLLNDLPARSAALDLKAFKLFPYRNSLASAPGKQRIAPELGGFQSDMGCSIKFEDVVFYPAQGAQALLSIAEWEVGNGDWVLVRGGNGSGKSTLGSILSGGVPEHRPGYLEGKALLSGVPVGSRSTLKWSSHTQFVQQNPFLSFSGCTFTVGEEVAFGPENLALRSGEIRCRVSKALDIAGALHLEGRQLLQLSGGEAQRVAIAAALAMQPRLLLLDEAFSRIHEDDIPIILSRIKDWCAKSMSNVVLFERNGEEMEPFCEKSAHLAGGVLVPAISPLKRDIGSFFYSTPSPDKAGLKSSLPVMQLRGLSFSWAESDKKLLRHINASLLPGARVALVGANGAGKSTLIRLCGGLLKPSEGEILLGNESVHKLHPRTRASKIGFLFQDPERQIFHTSVEDELLFSLRDEPITPEEKRARLSEALRITGLSGLERLHPLDLNSAERRMVAVASLSVRNLDLLLLDEPTRELDDHWLEIFVRWLDTRQAAVLAISHDRLLVSKTFESVWSLRAGELHFHQEGAGGEMAGDVICPGTSQTCIKNTA